MFWYTIARVAAAQQLVPVPDTSFVLPGEPLAFGLAAADFDLDGNVDLAWTEVIGGRVSVAYGAGAGAFAPPVVLDPGTEAPIYGWLAAGDLDGDGYGDLFTPTSDPAPGVSGWAGGPSGLGGPTWRLGTGDPLTVLGDVDGDGTVDLGLGLDVWLGTPAGPAFAARLPGALVYPYSAPWPVGDVDGDGDDDLYVPNHAVAGAYWDGMDGPASLIRYDPTGGSALWTVDPGLGAGALAVALDVDGDSVDDLVSVDGSREDDAFWGGIDVWSDLANPLGPTRLTVTPIDLDIGQGFTVAARDDDDGDGKQTLLLGAFGLVHELAWDPALGFDWSAPIQTWGHPTRIVQATLSVDLNGDGLRDLVTSFASGSGDSEVAVWLTPPIVLPADTGDTGTVPSTSGTGDTGGPVPVDTLDTGTPSTVDDTAASRKEPTDTGCGCAAAGRTGGLALVLGVALALRRRTRVPRIEGAAERTDRS